MHSKKLLMLYILNTIIELFLNVPDISNIFPILLNFYMNIRSGGKKIMAYINAYEILSLRCKCFPNQILG